MSEYLIFGKIKFLYFNNRCVLQEIISALRGENTAQAGTFAQGF